MSPPDRGVALAVLVALAACDAGALEPGHVTGALAEPPPQGAVRLVSWNLGSATHPHPEGALSAPDALAVMISDLRRMRRDPSDQWNVFVLQEVDRDTNRSGHRDHPQEIADAMGSYDGRNPYTGYESAFARTLWFDGGSYGIAAVSNHRLDDVRALTYSCSGADAETRRAQMIRLAHAPTPTWIVNTHLSRDTLQSVCQERQLLAWIHATVPDDDIVVIAGDLNIIRDGPPDADPSKDHQAAWAALSADTRAAGFRNVGNGEHTFPSGDPWRTIDHVFVRDPRHELMRIDFDVADSGAAVFGVHPTDHRPVIADLRWCHAGCRSLPGIL